MKIKELYPDVITEDTSYEYKAVLNPDNPIKWAKTLIGYANDKGGTLFIGVSNDGEAFGIDLEEVDKTKLLISRINDRHIFPHIKISYMIDVYKRQGVCRWEADLSAGCCTRHMGKYSGLDLEYCQVFK